MYKNIWVLMFKCLSSNAFPPFPSKVIFGGAVGRAGEFPFKRAERAVKVGTEANKSELVQRPYG